MESTQKRKKEFTKDEMDQIFSLVREKNKADRSTQKNIRNKIRRIGFHYGDFSKKKHNYTVEDIRKLISEGIIKIKDVGDMESLKSPNNNKVIKDYKKIADDTKRSFSPIHRGDATILILGTMPGDTSLTKAEYYAKSNNSFWKILCKIFDRPHHFISYSDKRDFLKEHKIALWDVYREAKRKGSLDKDIKNGIVNDINTFLAEHPSIKKVLFNGKEANKIYNKYFQALSGIRYHVLPSTSPANTTRFEEKLNRWEEAVLERL